MLKYFILISAFLVMMISSKASAQEFAPVGTAVGQFLEIGVGAKSTAMGEAYTAMASGASSVFWNPAGLVETEARGFYLAYTSWPADISIGGMSFAWNFDNYGSLALSAVYLNTGDMDVTTINDPEGTSGQQFSLTNYAFGLTYARNLTTRLSLGATVKMVNEEYFGFGYTTWAMDVGTLYRTAFRGLTMGMSILHFGQEIAFDGTYTDFSDDQKEKDFKNYSLPITFRVGFMMDVWESGKSKVISTADMTHPNNNLEQYNWGFEYGFDNMFFVRSGYKFRADQGGFSLGAGVNYEIDNNLSAELNYAFSEMGILPSVHRLSAGFTF